MTQRRKWFTWITSVNSLQTLLYETPSVSYADQYFCLLSPVTNKHNFKKWPEDFRWTNAQPLETSSPAFIVLNLGSDGQGRQLFYLLDLMNCFLYLVWISQYEKNGEGEKFLSIDNNVFSLFLLLTSTIDLRCTSEYLWIFFFRSFRPLTMIQHSF